MHNLFFILQHDRQLKRKILILKYLASISRNQNASSRELACTVGCSTPTIRADIDILNKQLPEKHQIIELSRGVFKLKCPENISIDSLITDLAMQTTAYKIIDNIFNNNIYTFNEAMDVLYLSKSTLYRCITKINSCLNFFDISISTSTLNFIGSEQSIRYFLFSFYSDFRTSLITYNNNDPRFKNFFNIYNSKKELSKLHVSQFRIEIWLNISITRFFHNNLLFFEKKFIDNLQTHDEYIVFQDEFKKAISIAFGFDSMPIEEIVFSYCVRLHSISYSSTSISTQKVTHLYHHIEKFEATLLIDKLLSIVFPPDIFKSKHLEKLKGFLINLRLISKITPLFQYVSLPLKIHVKDHYPDLYNKWYHILMTHNFFTIKHIEDVAVSLTMLHFDVINTFKDNKVNIMFFFQCEAGYDTILVNKVKSLLNGLIHAEYIFDISITDIIIKDNPADLIVSNYDIDFLKNLSYEFFGLSHIPTNSEWDSLKNKILDIQKKNN